MNRIVTIIAATAMAISLGSSIASAQTTDREQAGCIGDEAGYLIEQSRWKYNDWEGSTKIPELLTLAVMTDLHGFGENLERYLDFCDRYKSYINDKIQLGDIIWGNWDDDFSYFTSAPGADSIMMVIGNHDTRDSQDGSQWTKHCGKDAYQRYFAPFRSGWLSTVKQPSKAEKYGKCWYYKDYPESGVKLVVLDAMSYCPEEQTWFKDVLDDALQAKMSVICAQHLPVGKVNPVTNFNSIDYQSYSGGYSGSPEPYLEAVDNYIEDGGDFVCWMSGDSHFDFVGTLIDHPKQFSMTFENAGLDSWWNDSPRIKGTKSQDSFNIVTFDTWSKLIKVVRVGNTRDRYLRKKESFCYNWAEKKVISEN